MNPGSSRCRRSAWRLPRRRTSRATPRQACKLHLMRVICTLARRGWPAYLAGDVDHDEGPAGEAQGTFGEDPRPWPDPSSGSSFSGTPWGRRDVAERQDALRSLAGQDRFPHEAEDRCRPRPCCANCATAPESRACARGSAARTSPSCPRRRESATSQVSGLVSLVVGELPP